MDASGDGYGRAEACGVAVVGAVPQGQEEHPPLALILGHAVNQDGRSSSLTAPNGPSQQALLRMAHQASHTPPELFGTVSLHGTGTSLGDPIEVGAVATVFADNMSTSGFAMKADKTAFGHAEPAAGVVSLFNGITATSNASIQPLLHLRSLNPYVQAILLSTAMEAGATHVPREVSAAAASHAASEHHVTGSSGFAFQVSSPCGDSPGLKHLHFPVNSSWSSPIAGWTLRHCMLLHAGNQLPRGVRNSHGAVLSEEPLVRAVRAATDEALGLTFATVALG